MQSDERRFWSKVKIKHRGQCWEWQAAKDRKGYGHFWYAGRIVKAHRFAWGLENGEIPTGMIVMHACDNPACCKSSAPTMRLDSRQQPRHG